MGMGDKKTPYEPFYAPVRDDVLGRVFSPCLMRKCVEPRVIARYGIGGVCHVSWYTCKKCKYARKHEFHGGLSCGYEPLEQGIQEGADGKLG